MPRALEPGENDDAWFEGYVPLPDTPADAALEAERLIASQRALAAGLKRANAAIKDFDARAAETRNEMVKRQSTLRRQFNRQLHRYRQDEANAAHMDEALAHAEAANVTFNVYDYFLTIKP